MESLVVVGLGNPGSEYEATRHNVGFRVVDTLAARWKKPFSPGKGEYLFAHAEIGGRTVELVKPLTYMNNSGAAVVEVLTRFEVAATSLLIVADDLALPLGTLRLRGRGSDGGHNGLYSIIYQLQSDEFARLRCGIGQEQPIGGDVRADFVLSSFNDTELETANAMILRAAETITNVATEGLARAMSTAPS